MFQPSRQDAPQKDKEDYHSLLKSFNRELDPILKRFRDELMAKLNIDPLESITKQNELLQGDYCGYLLLNFQNTLVSGLSKYITSPFNFDPTLELIQACNQDKFSREFQGEILKLCKLQFYLVLICKIDFVINLFRKNFDLPVTKKKVDPLASHNPGRHLLELRGICKNGFKNEVPAFNFDDFSILYNTCQQGNYSTPIKDILSEIYRIIINDIKTPASQLGWHFSYGAINLSIVVDIITDLQKQEHESNLKQAEQEKQLKELETARKKKEKEQRQYTTKDKITELSDGKTETRDKRNDSPVQEYVNNINYGELYWRICLVLNSQQAEQFLKHHRELITKIRQSQSFRSYELFNNNGQMLCRHVLQNPWIMNLFTIYQMVSFINSPPFLIEQNIQLQFAGISQEVRGIRHSLISSRTIQKDSRDVRNRAPNPQEQQRKLLINFLAGFPAYTKNVLNEVAVQTNFVSTIGIHSVLLPLLEPCSLVSLFLEADKLAPFIATDLIIHLEKNIPAAGKKIPANIIRDFVEYDWLLIRIIEDIRQGNETYFNELLKIPYLLYELIKRENIDGSDFTQIPAQQLLEFFKVFNHTIILQTLQLLDPQDKIHSNMDFNGELYEVDKNNSHRAFQRFAQLLLAREFLSMRLSWLSNDDASSLFTEYPFLLKGFNSNTIHDFVNTDRDLLLQHADLCMKNGVIPFFECPQLLVYLNTHQVSDMFKAQKTALTELFRRPEIPTEVITYFTDHLSQLAQDMPELRGCLENHARQIRLAELDALIAYLPVAAKPATPKTPTDTTSSRQNQTFISLDEALSLLEETQQRQKEKAEQQAQIEQERKRALDEQERERKQEEEKFQEKLREEQMLVLVLADKNERLADQRKRREEEQKLIEEEEKRIEEQRRQWQIELTRIRQEEAALNEQVAKEKQRRKLEEEQRSKKAAELARLQLEEQQRLAWEEEQRLQELQSLRKKQEEERTAYELALKNSEELHHLKIAEYERRRKEIEDARSQHQELSEQTLEAQTRELARLQKEKEEAIAKRETELKRLEHERAQQQAKMVEEQHQRELAEQERVKKAQEDERRKKEAEETRKKVEREQQQKYEELQAAFKKAEERRKKEFQDLEKRAREAEEEHYRRMTAGKDRSAKASEDATRRRKAMEDAAKLQDAENSRLEQQERELAQKNVQLEERRKKLADDEARIIQEGERITQEENKIIKAREELSKITADNERKSKELDDAYSKQELETAELNKMEQALILLSTEQKAFREQLIERSAELKQQETEHKQKLEENTSAMQLAEEEFQSNIAENKRRQQALEEAKRVQEQQRQKIECETLQQEEERQAKLAEEQLRRKTEEELSKQRMAALEKEISEQQGLARELLDEKRKEIDRIKREREQELARQQQELELLKEQEVRRKRQLAAEEQRRKEEEAKYQESLGVMTHNQKELEAAHIKMVADAEQRRREIELARKAQQEKIEEDQRRSLREAAEIESKTRQLEEARRKQELAKEQLRQKEAALESERQQNETYKKQLEEQEKKLVRERTERAAAQEKLRKEQEEESKRDEDDRKKKAEQEKQRKHQEEARNKEAENKRQEFERKKKAELEKQRKEQETRKKEEEHKRQEEERKRLSQAEQEQRQKRIEEERRNLAENERSLTKRQQELAAQPPPPGFSPRSLAVSSVDASPSTLSSVRASDETASSLARDAAALGVFAAKPPAGASPRSGDLLLQSSSPRTPQAETEEVILKRAAATHGVREKDPYRRTGRIMPPTTVTGGLASYTRDQQAIDEALATDPIAGAIAPKTPSTPVIKPPGSPAAKK